MARTAPSRSFTPAYVLYLAAIAAATVAAFRYTHPRVETLEDMERPDYRNVEGRILQKIDSPRLLHELAAGASVTHDGVEYRTNSDGMRDDREYPVEKPPGYRRLVFLGDSFTFGSGVVLEQTFVKQLAALLEGWTDVPYRWEVLNLGVPGYGTINEVESLEEKGLKYAPDVVIVMYHLNDAFSLQETALGDGRVTWTRLVAYLNGDADAAEAAEVEAFLTAKGWMPTLTEMPKNVRKKQLYASYLAGHYLPLYWQPMTEAFQRLADLSQAFHFDVIVAIIPELDYGWESYPFDDIHARVRAECERHAFYVIDLKPSLEQFEHTDLMLWGTDGHTNAFADYIIARLLEGHLAIRYGHHAR